MSHRRAVFTLLLLILGVTMVTPVAAVTTYPLPIGYRFESAAGGITTGPDGGQWFTSVIRISDDASFLGRIDPSGVVTQYQLPPGFFWDSGGSEIAAGSDGNLWFTGIRNPGGSHVGRITPTGSITTFALAPGLFYEARSAITAGADGNLWFTTLSDGPHSLIGRITMGGAITTFPLPAPFYLVSGSDIVAGPDGNLWFTGVEDGTSNPLQDYLGRITPSGTMTFLPFPAGFAFAGSEPSGIAVGSDGNLWFTSLYYASGEFIGRMTVTGAAALFSLGNAYFQTGTGIVAGGDGNLWIPGLSSAGIRSYGRLTPAGLLTVAPLPAGVDPLDDFVDISAAPSGDLWFTQIGDGGANSIGRFVASPTAILAPRTVKVTIPAGSASATKIIKVKVRNTDVVPVRGPARPVHLTLTTSCPAGSVGVPDFDPATAGTQDTVTLAGGEVAKAEIPLTIAAAAFFSPSSKAADRCTLTLTAIATNADLARSSSTVPLVVDVLDETDH